MKVPIDRYTCLNLDAPTLSAEDMTTNGVMRWRAWCAGMQGMCQELYDQWQLL
jgi:hypothetical protein